jgi:quinol monooxygenase YgiN
MSWIQRNVFCLCVCAMSIASVALATPASGQDGNIRSITFYTVKPDRVGDFQAEIKEYNAILAKSGSTLYSQTWVSLTGDHEYAHVISYKSWADLDYSMTTDPKMKDQAMDLTRISMRINDCAESSRRVIEEVLPEFSTPSNGEIPKMIRVLQTQVRPDKVDEYLDLVKNVIVPAVKKGGTTAYNVAEGRMGESNLQITSVTGFNSWADLDAGIGAQKGMSKDEYQALLNKVRGLITSSEYDVYRYEPDLSFPRPPAAK